MFPCDDGEYVRHDDYAALEAEVDRLKVELDKRLLGILSHVRQTDVMLATKDYERELAEDKSDE